VSIAYVNQRPAIEPEDGGFLVTLTSGDEETTFLLSLAAMTALCGVGMSKVREAQAAQFEATPFQRRKGGKAR
jgi:hypothetical protein